QDSSRDRANGRVSETLGKAAQGSASLGRVRLPNIQASSNAACRCHGAKIHVKPRDRSTRLYRSRATAPKADENFNELVKKLAHTTTITRVRRANGRQPVAAAAEGTATGTAMQQQQLVEQEEKEQTPDGKKNKQQKEEKEEKEEQGEKQEEKKKLREEASKLRPGLAVRSPLTYQQERAALYSHDRGFPSGALDEKFRRCGGSTRSGEVEEGVLGKEFTIDSALAFTSPPRPGARSFAKGITTRRRERRQTDGKGDAEGKRTAKKERETVRDGEGEKEKQEKEEEAGGGRGFLARRTRVLATVAWFDDEDKEDVERAAARRLALSEREERGGGQTAPTGKSAARRASRLTLGSQRSRPRWREKKKFSVIIVIVVVALYRRRGRRQGSFRSGLTNLSPRRISASRV
ncbi:hypothetical protein ALC60_05509, partial [Trachymyrmex zeteki]